MRQPVSRLHIKYAFSLYRPRALPRVGFPLFRRHSRLLPSIFFLIIAQPSRRDKKAFCRPSFSRRFEPPITPLKFCDI
jgi:hypothetical protein